MSSRPPAVRIGRHFTSVAAMIFMLAASLGQASVGHAQDAQNQAGDNPAGNGLSDLRFISPSSRIAMPEPMPGPVLRFVVADDFPPFAFIDGAGRLAGLHIDLIRRMCDTLDLPCTLQARRFDRVLDAVAEDEDTLVLAAGLAIDDETTQQFDFSLPYFRYAGRFVSRVGANEGADWLETATLGVVEGTAHAAFLRDAYAGAQVQTFASRRSLVRALLRNEITHVFADGLDLAFWLVSPQADDCCAFFKEPVFSSHYFGEGLAFAVPQGQPRLVQALNAALQRIETSGELETLMLTSFPLDPFGQ